MKQGRLIFLLFLIILTDTFSTFASTEKISASSLVVKTLKDSQLKEFANTNSFTIKNVKKGSNVKLLYIQDTWASIQFDNSYGFLNTDSLFKAEEKNPNQETIPVESNSKDKPKTTPENISNSNLKERASKVTFPTWSEVKANIFKLHIPAEVYDVKTGKIYYVKSFSNGNHADVEPTTAKDTQIMFETFNKEWSWDVRPVWVTISGQTIAGSINGMPHGSDTNPDNNMNGQICIHFKGSTTHNGNKDFAALHQKIALESYNLSLEYRK